jgi:hypothetical protein
MLLAVVSDHRPVLTPLHVSLSLRDCSALEIAGLQAVLGIGHRMPKNVSVSSISIFGFLVSFTLIATLTRLLNVVTNASRPRLPTFQGRYLECPDLTVCRIGMGWDQSYHRLATGSQANTFLRPRVFPLVRVLSSTLSLALSALSNQYCP